MRNSVEFFSKDLTIDVLLELFKVNQISIVHKMTILNNVCPAKVLARHIKESNGYHLVALEKLCRIDFVGEIWNNETINFSLRTSPLTSQEKVVQVL